MDQVMDQAGMEQLLADGNANRSLATAMATQKRQAEMMRGMGSAMNNGGEIVSGRYVPQGWAKTLAGIGASVGAAQQSRAADLTSGKMDVNTGRQNDAIMRALMRNQGMQQPAQPHPMMAPQGYA